MWQFEVILHGTFMKNLFSDWIENAQINDVEKYGISVSGTKSCVIKNCQINNCKNSSIAVYDYSNVIVTNNRISQIGKFCFNVFNGGIITAEQNIIKNIGESMAGLFFKGNGSFINNQISGCIKQYICKNPSLFVFKNNGNFCDTTNDLSKVDDSISFEKLPDDEDIPCLMCHKNKRDTYLVLCGHKVYCSECAEKALEKKEKCPLCGLDIYKALKGYDSTYSGKCIICLNKTASCIIYPCCHVCMCQTCSKQFFQAKNQCPVCRKNAESKYFIYNEF